MVDSRFSTFSIIENYFWNYTYKESMNLIINAVTNCHFLNDRDFPSYKQMTLYDLSISLSLSLSLSLYNHQEYNFRHIFFCVQWI